MTPSNTDTTEVHECHQAERLTRIDNHLFGNGSEGLMTKIARMEVRVTWVLRLNWFLATSWFLTIVGVLAHLLINSKGNTP